MYPNIVRRVALIKNNEFITGYLPFYCKQTTNCDLIRLRSTAVGVKIHSRQKVRDASEAGRQNASFNIPDFTDTRTIYQAKNFRELFRAYVVFTLCSFDVLVNNQLKLLSWAQKLLGRGLFRRLMRATIYGQFMAGETEAEVLDVARRNAQAGLYAMFSYTAPEVHGAAKDTEGFSSQLNIHEKNYDAIRHCVHMAAASKEFSILRPQLATKLTYFTPSQVLFNLNTVLEQQSQLLHKLLLNNKDKQQTKEFQDFLRTVLTKSENSYSGTGMILPRNISASDLYVPSLATNLPFNLTLSQSPELATFSKDKPAVLSPEDEKHIVELWRKMDNLGKVAEDEGVVIIWDAEQTYLQTAIECMALDTIRKYNTKRAVIHNTYQCYLTRTLDVVVRDLDLSQKEGVSLGLKVVRGAYLDEERRRAETLGYPDPVNPTYDATTHMYESVASRLLESVRGAEQGRIHVTFATHNEDTVRYVLTRMNELGVSLDAQNVAFAQLIGMRDHISFSLGHHRIPVGKLHHYGIIEEGIAYLSRRLNENRSGVPTATVERNLIGRELRRRILRF